MTEALHSTLDGTTYRILRGTALLATVSQRQDGWRLHSNTSRHRGSRRSWETPEEAARSVLGTPGETAVRTARDVRPFAVIGLPDLGEHGSFETLEQARGCVVYDMLHEYQIWYAGTVLVEAYEA